MGFYADTQKEERIHDGYYECTIIADNGPCWRVSFISESEVDAVHSPLMSRSKSSTPLINKSRVYQVGEVDRGSSTPMHQVERLEFIDSELVVRSTLLASRKVKQDNSELFKAYVRYCSQIRVLIIVLSMRKGPAIWKRLVTGHARVNAYLMRIDGYPNVIIGLVGRAILIHPVE